MLVPARLKFDSRRSHRNSVVIELHYVDVGESVESADDDCEGPVREPLNVLVYVLQLGVVCVSVMTYSFLPPLPRGFGVN